MNERSRLFASGPTATVSHNQEPLRPSQSTNKASNTLQGERAHLQIGSDHTRELASLLEFNFLRCVFNAAEVSGTL